MEISFHIPNSNTQFVGDENRPPAQVGFFLYLSKIVWFTCGCSLMSCPSTLC